MRSFDKSLRCGWYHSSGPDDKDHDCSPVACLRVDNIQAACRISDICIIDMGKIELCGMRFFAHHGCFHEEKVIGNHFVVDFEVWTDTRAASLSDSLDDTLNYQCIYDMVKEEMAVSSNLLEHVAGTYTRRFREHSLMWSMPRISIAKLNLRWAGRSEPPR